MSDLKTQMFNMYTFRSNDEKITASVQLDNNGDLLIKMKPHGKYSEEEMYELFKRLGFYESVAPLKDLII